jgi:hypothetical protein
MSRNDGPLEIEDVLIKRVLQLAYVGTNDVYCIQRLAYHIH